MGYYIDFHLQKDWELPRNNGGGVVIGSCRTQIWWDCPWRIPKEELAGFSQRSWDFECLAVQVCIWSDCVNDQQDFGSNNRLAYQLINFSDECLLWGNWCCFKVCSVRNLVVLLSLSLGASRSTMISLCYDPVVAQSRSESYHQSASKLSGALCWRGWKRKEILHLCLWNLNSTSNSPVASRRLSCQISLNQHEVETSTNVNKYWKTHTKDNDVTNVIFANQHFSSTFWCRYSNSRDVVASSPSFSHLPPECSGELAHRLEYHRHSQITKSSW